MVIYLVNKQEKKHKSLEFPAVAFCGKACVGLSLLSNKYYALYSGTYSV